MLSTENSFPKSLAGPKSEFVSQRVEKDWEIFPDEPPQSLKQKIKLTTCPSSKPNERI
jgi:hypothetical protein